MKIIRKEAERRKKNVICTYRCNEHRFELGEYWDQARQWLGEFGIVKVELDDPRDLAPICSRACILARARCKIKKRVIVDETIVANLLVILDDSNLSTYFLKWYQYITDAVVLNKFNSTAKVMKCHRFEII